jgi:hypothetical protein
VSLTVTAVVPVVDGPGERSDQPIGEPDAMHPPRVVTSDVHHLVLTTLHGKAATAVEAVAVGRRVVRHCGQRPVAA